MHEQPGQRLRILALAIGFEGGLGGLAWGLGWFLDQPALADFRWDWHDTALGVAATLPLVLLFLLLRRCPFGPIVRIREMMDEIIPELFGACTWLELALISGVAGVGEEMLFRGVVQAVITRHLGAGMGLALASLLFGLMHPITPLYVVLTALVGVYLGWLYSFSGNLLVVIVVHALYDWVVLLYLLRGARRLRLSDGSR